MAPLNKDLHLSAEFVTFLRSGFYGQILFESALSRLEYSLLPDGYLDIAHRAFDRIDVWSKDIATELPIFATGWTSPETFDAISAMSFMKDLKKDLQWLIPQVEAALRAPNLWQNRDAVKLLVASLVRSAAARSSYVETLYATFVELKAHDLAERVSYEIEGAKEYLRVTNIILDTFADSGVYDQNLCDKLRREASLTPSDFRSHIHDASILLNVYAKEFSFDLADIPRDEAKDWMAKQIPAVAAGHWRAYNFSPEEFLEWRSVGVLGAPLAANWRRANFSPREAIVWITEGLSPLVAIEWNRAGFEPPRAAALIRRGITDPSKAPRNEYDNTFENEDDLGETPEEEENP